MTNYDRISLSSSENEKGFRQKLYRKSKHTFNFQQIVFENRAVYETMWKSIVESERPQVTIWRMRISRWIPKATNTLSEYVIIIAFLLKQWLHERASILRYSILPCLVRVNLH